MKSVFLLLLFVCLIVACKKNEQRIPQNTSVLGFDTLSLRLNISDQLQAVYFTSGKDGFVAGYKGGIYKTTDSAKTWTALNATTTLPIYSLFFTDSLQGFAVGGQVGCSTPSCTSPGGFILKTTNGGQSWTNVYTPSEKIEITSVYFVNSSVGFCVGRGIIMKTTDAGQTWTETKVAAAERFMKQVRFSNTQEGYIVCSNNVIITTRDGGSTWSVLNTPTANGYYAVAATDGVVYASALNTIIKSTNKGTSWTTLPNAPGEINIIHFVDDKTGYAAGTGRWSGGDFGYSYGALYSTSNGGLSWNGSSDIRTGDIKDISFPAGKIAYALSNGGYSGASIIRLTLK